MLDTKKEIIKNTDNCITKFIFLLELNDFILFEVLTLSQTTVP